MHEQRLCSVIRALNQGANILSRDWEKIIWNKKEFWWAGRRILQSGGELFPSILLSHQVKVGEQALQLSWVYILALPLYQSLASGLWMGFLPSREPRIVRWQGQGPGESFWEGQGVDQMNLILFSQSKAGMWVNNNNNKIVLHVPHE